MRYNRLGNSGLQVSALGLGTNSFGKRADQETSVRILHTAMDQGINFIDTANIYAALNRSGSLALRLKADAITLCWRPRPDCRSMRDPAAAALRAII